MHRSTNGCVLCMQHARHMVLLVEVQRNGVLVSLDGLASTLSIRVL
jgi:hypothetical protein